MRLFLTGAWSPTLPFLRKKDLAQVLNLWATPATEMVVVTEAKGVDSFAAAYFKDRGVAVTFVPMFTSQASRDYQIVVELDIDYAFVASWEKNWIRKLSLLEVPHSVLWEPQST
jgi:hypothetical protein